MGLGKSTHFQVASEPASCLSVHIPSAMAPKTEKKAPSHPPYQALIKEAISALKERNGSSLSAITKYVGEKHSLPGPWKKTLSLQLKRLTEAGKLVKVLTTVHAPVPARSIPRLPSLVESLLALCSPCMSVGLERAPHGSEDRYKPVPDVSSPGLESAPARPRR